MFQIERDRFTSRNRPVGAAAAQPKRITPTILIAEDSRDGREMLQVLLGLKGYSVLAAADGKEAVEVALENLPDLILLDLELPGLDGLSVARDLRSHSDFKNIPIIVLSGHDPTKHKQSAIEAGCTDYLLKPLDFQRLDEILQNEVPL
jgi:CheY-like chemotaxis protein